MKEYNSEKLELIKQAFKLKHSNNFKEAIEVLYKALELENDEEDKVEILSQIGELHFKLNNYERALEQFQNALSINKTHVFSMLKCFDIYFKLEQYKKAHKIALELCENNKSPQSYLNYLKSLIKLDKINDAIEIFNSLDEEIKLDVDILYLISTITPIEKKPFILEKIISIDETHKLANIELAGIEFEKGNYNKVISYCLNVVEENANISYYLAHIEANRKNYNKSIELFKKAIKLDNLNPEFYLGLTKTYIDMFSFKEALETIKKAIDISLIHNKKENIDEKYFLYSWLLNKLNKDNKALETLQLIDKNSIYFSNAKILTQVINLKNYNLASALKELEDSYIYERENIFLLDTLAGVYKELKLTKKAIEIYKQALKFYPNSIYYKVEIIDLLIDIQEYEEAMKIIDILKLTSQNCANIYNSLARIYYRMKNYDNALYNLNQYLLLDKNNAEVNYFKGLILNDLSRFKEAKENIYNAIKLNPSCAKYYFQMAKSYIGTKDYSSALLYSIEAIEINPDEINYKKQALEIATLIGNKEQIALYEKQLKRSEAILKSKR